MSLKSRSTSPSLRGSGGGGGSISVHNTDCETTENIVSPQVKKLVFAMEALGIYATVDADDPSCVIVGDPPVFESKLSWSPVANTLVRVSESDPAEPDPFEAGGFENTNLGATNNPNPAWHSTLGRGLGADASLLVTVKYAGTVVDSQTFTADGNGIVTKDYTTVTVSNYADDGDGSAQKGNITVKIDLNAMIGYNFSGNFDILIRFTEHKWGEVITFTENFFYDKNPNTPVINGVTSIREDDTPANRITKYLSGIQYYTTGSPFTLEALTIDNHNQDSSHPTASLMLGSASFGIADFTSSPWVDTVDWSNVGNLDSSQGFDFLTSKTIDVANYRHVGNATVSNIIRDSWGQAANKPSNTLKVAIDTVVNPSTDSVEYFDEENKRLANDYASSWDSERYCIDGEGIVYGGSLYHGSDLPRILDNTVGALGTAGSLTNNLPDENTTGLSRQNPNYTGHTKEAVFFRQFLTGNTTTSYSTMNMNILSNGDLSTKLTNGDIKIYIWKLDSIDPASTSLILPPAYNTTNQGDSLVNSLWGHESYNFAEFDDGLAQTAGGSGTITNIAGNLLTLSFGDYSVVEGVLVRFQIKKGTRLDEVSVSFT